MIDPADTRPQRALTAQDAGHYLGVGDSVLARMRRARRDGETDPKLAGPPYLQITRKHIVYEIRDLDAWLDLHPRI